MQEMTTVFVLSDFGVADTYSGQMKASFLKAYDGPASFVDLSTSIPPGDIRAGAFHLLVSQEWLPAGSGVLAIVDPGVGSSRRALLCRGGGVFFAGPDNGLFSWISLDAACELPAPAANAPATFHGRDVFAPALAAAMRVPAAFDRFRPVPLDALIRLPRPMATVDEGVVETAVASVDTFGNCILWLSESDIPGLVVTAAKVRGKSVPVRKAYTYDSDGLSLLKGSSGFLELAVSGGRADGLLGLHAGDPVFLETEEA